MTFSETRINLGYDYGAMGGPRFSTTILTQGNGQEQRNVNWSQPLGRWQLGSRTLFREEIDSFLAFHTARKGSLQGFRFKDWSDYKFSNQIGTGNGSKTQFQLYKTYTAAGQSVKRPITKPVTGTVQVKVNGSTVTFTLNSTTGVVTLTTAPSTGATVTASGEFDVPVRFEQDSINFRFVAADPDSGEALFELQQLSVIEIRVSPGLALSLDSVPSALSHTLNIGYDYDTVGGPSFSTGIIANSGGFESRVNNWDIPRKKFQVGDRTVTRSELEYLLSLFRICRGNAVEFQFKDWQNEQEIKARFDSEEISFRFDAQDVETGEAIFYLSGLPIVQTGANYAELLFSTTSTFEDTIVEAYPPNGIYPFPITAPSSLDVYSDDQIRAYLIGAQWDNRAVLGLFSRDTLGTFSGDYFIGIGKNFNAVIIQDSLGPCYFLGTIRWEAWRLD
jgi:uncharacterized protein (TIGR02217 family)